MSNLKLSRGFLCSRLTLYGWFKCSSEWRPVERNCYHVWLCWHTIQYSTVPTRKEKLEQVSSDVSISILGHLAGAFVRSDSQSFIHSYPDAGGCRPTIRQPAVPTAAPSLHSCCLENSHVVLGLIISWPFSSFDLRLCRLFQRATYQFNQHSNTTFKKKIQYRHNTEGLD